NLRRPVEVAFDQQRTCVSAESESSGKEQRAPRNDFCRLAHVGDNRLERLLGAGAHSCKRQRSPHQPQKTAARNRIQPLGSALRKFAVHRLAKFFAAGKLFQATPVFGTGGSLEVLAYLGEIFLSGS